MISQQIQKVLPSMKMHGLCQTFLPIYSRNIENGRSTLVEKKEGLRQMFEKGGLAFGARLFDSTERMALIIQYPYQLLVITAHPCCRSAIYDLPCAMTLLVLLSNGTNQRE